MSTKEQRPVLSGQRLKTRKRDEKTKFEPEAFRDDILEGFADCEKDLDKATKFLETAGGKLDYHRYGEALFDILIAGGLLEPGGTVVDDESGLSPISVFAAADDEETIKSYARMMNMVIRRYKYLEKALDHEMHKLLLFLKGFSAENKSKLAKLFAFLLEEGNITLAPLSSLFNDSLTKDGDSLDFVTAFFQVVLRTQPSNALHTALKKAKLDDKLMDFFPSTRRTVEEFKRHFTTVPGVDYIVTIQTQQLASEIKKELAEKVAELLQEEDVQYDSVIALAQEEQKKGDLSESDILNLLFDTVMDAVDWNKKQDLVVDQAVRQLQSNVKVFAAFATHGQSQLNLLLKLQNYCYENQGLLRAFQKLVFILYKGDVVSEDVVLSWYHKAHSSKGKSVFLEQMTKFVEWLQNAEEESDDDDDDDEE